MTKSHLALRGLLVLLAGLPLASRAGDPLIVVEDRGGTSALPYYEALNLQPRADVPARPPIPTPQVPATPADEAAMLPVRSTKLTPGTVARRVIEAPGLRPFVVIGDDDASRAWLQRRGVALRERGAVGLVVNVETAQGLAGLRALVPGVPLAPVAGDDLADRLGLRHYPALITATGIEGSLVYAASAVLRDRIASDGSATLHLDLLPQLPPERVLAEVKHPRGSRSLSSHLKSRLHLGPLKLGLLHELLTREQMLDATALAAALKALPLTLQAPRPIAEAISTAGGVRFEALTDGLMLKALPGVFCAGEMLDWEAPTGGYLLTASLASGRRAAQGLRAWLAGHG